jgi:hypothetical protein
MGLICCTACRSIRHYNTKEESLLGDEQLSVKAIRFAVYSVCKETNVTRFPDRWNSVVETYAGHYMDLTFRPEYTLDTYVLLFKSCLEVHNRHKLATDVFDFLL